MTLTEEKAAMRKAAFAARKAAHGPTDPTPALALLRSWIAGQGTPHRISAYAAIRTELDPAQLMHTLHAAGHQVLLPVVVGAGKPLTFRLWTPETKLTPGAFGAPIPPAGPEHSPDLVIAPLLAFDRSRYRLGYGGGFYDRTLAQLRQRAPVPAAGLAYAAQEVAHVPRDSTDVQLDAIVTEREILR